MCNGANGCPFNAEIKISLEEKQTIPAAIPNEQLPADVVKEIENNAKLRLIRNGNTSFHRGYYSGEISGATEYASKLHLEQQAHEETRQSFKKQLNDRLHQAQQENEKARTLLQKFITRHEAGLLPDRFIYDEIKQFLDGK
jgi:flagellar hook-basal body complex protein FliE